MISEETYYLGGPTSNYQTLQQVVTIMPKEIAVKSIVEIQQVQNSI